MDGEINHLSIKDAIDIEKKGKYFDMKIKKILF